MFFFCFVFFVLLEIQFKGMLDTQMLCQFKDCGVNLHFCGRSGWINTVAGIEKKPFRGSKNCM